MPAKKKVTKKAAPKKVEPAKVDHYANITSSKVDGVTVYKYKSFTSIKLAKIKRYVDADVN